MENEFEIKREKIDWIETPVENLKVGDFIKISPDDKDYLRIKEINDDGNIIADKAVHNGNIKHLSDGSETEDFDVEQNVKLDKKDFTLLYRSKRNDIVAEMVDYVKVNYTDDNSVFKMHARKSIYEKYDKDTIDCLFKDLYELMSSYKTNMEKPDNDEAQINYFVSNTFYHFIKLIDFIIQDERDTVFIEDLDAVQFADMLDDE